MTSLRAATTTPPAQLRHRARINLAVFVVVAVGIGWLGITMDDAAQGATGRGSMGAGSSGTSGQALWIMVPVLTAIALRFARPDGGGPLGLSPRLPHPLRWWAFALGIYPTVLALAVAVGVATGLAELRLAPGSGPAILAATGASIGTLLVKNTFEELAFRGYGTRTALAAGLPRFAAHAVAGLAWGLWHLPLYLVWSSATDQALVTSLAWSQFVPLFLLGILALSLLLGELRLRTGSIWPGVVVHTVGGALSLALLTDGRLVMPGHADVLVGLLPGSLTSTLLFGAIGWWLLRHPRDGVKSTER